MPVKKEKGPNGAEIRRASLQFGILFIGCNCARKMPVVLPHHLLPWLVRIGAFAPVKDEAVKGFWDHLDSVSCSYSPTSNRAHPCWLWGDDAVFNEQNQKLVVVCMGHVLDSRTNSWETCWPLFVYRCATLKQASCVHSLNLCAGGCGPNQDLSVGFPTLEAFLKPASWLDNSSHTPF